jgi:hypothetical protein
VKLLRYLTVLPAREILGIGDTKADETWLQVVGMRAAPANGRDALPGMDYYSSLPSAEGTLEILRRLRANGWESL